MAATGVPMVSNGDSPAGPDLVSPDLYRRFALPYERRLAEEARRLGCAYALHLCGNTTRILNDMISTGADALELDYKTDAALAHEKMKDRTTFIGNLDPGPRNREEKGALRRLRVPPTGHQPWIPF